MRLPHTSPCLLALLACVTFCAPATAQTSALSSREVRVAWDSGPAANPRAVESVVASAVLDAPGAPWLRLDFDLVQLAGDALAGTGARLRVTSVLDGAVQELDAIRVRQWQLTSAYFNGDAVLVEIVAPPFAGPSRVVLSRLTAGVLPPPQESITICNATDDRVLSTDPRAARLVPVGCTGWLIDDCHQCLLTAGHCAGDSMQVAEFNVPLSTASGNLQHPPPQHQYALDPSSLQTTGNGGVGNDWTYFGVFANATTGLTAAQAQGSTYVLAAPPAFDPAHDLRVTGYGTDDTPPQHNQVQQTHAGAWTTSNGPVLSYRADTTGGNSGSPVIHEPTGLAIGIHTHGGCTSTGGANNGTAASHSGLLAALANPRGICRAGVAPEGVPPDLLAPGVPTLVQVRAASSIVAGSVQLHARDGAGSFTAYPMSDAGGGTFSGCLPPFECGAQPQYYFSAQDAGCGTRTFPAGAPGVFLTAEVATQNVLFADDFQLDQGWSVSNTGGLTAGAWERAVPVNANRGDPPADADGSGACYLTQNMAGDSDVDDGTTSLTSPVLDLSGGAHVSWSWWLGSTSTIGAGDGFVVEVATDAAGIVWQVVRNFTVETDAWTSDAIEVGVDVPATSTVRFRFSVTDAGSGHVVEGGLDGFLVDSRSCTSPGAPFCAGDGSGTPCPCGNAGAAGRGCGHSHNAAGARLRAFGDPSVSSDLVALAADGLPDSAPALFFQGTTTMAGGAGAVFGDGLRCAGGAVIHLGTRIASGGAVALGHGVAGDPAISLAGLVPVAGGVRHYQAWFRNSAAFCSSDTFNTTNGLTLLWLP